jgi:hypothetical protein
MYAPDAQLVEAYSRGRTDGSSEISLERYLGVKLQSTRAAAAAGAAELDGALLDYVKTRKVMLEILHRFFDEPGLRLMREAYASEADRAVVATLQRRLADAPPLTGDRRLAAEIEFLVAAPDEFIPCVARTRPKASDETRRVELRPTL